MHLSLDFLQAFITASRQYTAHVTGRALDDLVPSLKLNHGSSDHLRESSSSTGTSPSFLLHGMSLEGAGWDDIRQQLVFDENFANLSEGSILPVVARFEWIPADAAAARRSDTSVEVPLYLNDSRKNLLISVVLKRCPQTHSDHFYQHGVALIAWRP